MSDKRILLDAAAFLDSAHAIRISAAPTADIREIVQRFLAACYQDAGKAPRLLDGDEVATIVGEILPRHFGVKDRLATATPEVLAAYLGFLDETEVVTHAFEQRHHLESASEEFLTAVASGQAHAGGVARLAKQETVKHDVERTGRNDPCPCGSGRKFKKCCWQLGR